MDRDKLISKLKSYDPSCDEEKVKKAIDFAIRYHGNQKRESGELYYYHPLEVAEIIINMRLDTSSVITAILHDTVEDTDLTLEEIEKYFGFEIAKLVDGVTKLTKIEFTSDHLRQAENFRKLLLAMSDDIRVLLVKLADRLHNMKTIGFVKSPEKRMKIALETMEIYAPLAERIGVQQIKLELQDSCFAILHPEIRDSIITRLEAVTETEKHIISDIISELQNTLEESSLKVEVVGRRKTPYSIWQKMKQKNVGLDQLSDIIAFRIIVDNVADCYRALGVIHTQYKMVPESFQDFISTPKNNGYQSLHTVIIGPMQIKIEVQIRTKEMHEIAEFGVAAHWRYKQDYHDLADGRQYRWIRELLAILEQANDPEEFLQNTKLAMYYDQVFCFTPHGHLIALPKGATTVDFAYAVHSDLGNHCVGAKINGRVVPLRSQLKNGDQVEIITSKNQTPSPSWEKFVTTGKAISEIKKFIRTQQRDQYIKLGQAIIDKSLKLENIQDAEQSLANLCESFDKRNTEELFHSIGEGSISSSEVVKYIVPPKSKLRSTLSFLKFRKSSKEDEHEKAIPIKGLIHGMAIHFAECCHPLPGDKIVGVIHSGSGITIHTTDCEMLGNLSSLPDRILDLTWDSDKANIPFVCRLKIMITNQIGSIAVLTTEIAKERCNIINFKITSRNVDFCEILIDIEVLDLNHLNKIIHILKSQEEINHVERYKI
jgi:GTP pyrophosphokinase